MVLCWDSPPPSFISLLVCFISMQSDTNENAISLAEVIILIKDRSRLLVKTTLSSFLQDGVMVLSATHRYKKKYVTSLLYKPI